MEKDPFFEDLTILTKGYQSFLFNFFMLAPHRGALSSYSVFISNGTIIIIIIINNFFPFFHFGVRVEPSSSFFGFGFITLSRSHLRFEVEVEKFLRVDGIRIRAAWTPCERSSSRPRRPPPAMLTNFDCYVNMSL